MRIRKFLSIPFIVIFVTSLLYLPLLFPSFADDTINRCNHTIQAGINNNNNCNQQNQNQNENQTQNNNQNVNITLSQPVQVPQLVTIVRATQLPKTGSPTDIVVLLGVFGPLGFVVRKLAKKLLIKKNQEI